MGVRFTMDPKAYLGKEFSGDRYQITHSDNFSRQEEKILYSLLDSGLFEDHIDRGHGIYKEKFTLGYLTHQALAKNLLKPGEAAGFQNFLVKLFSKVSKDRKFDTKKEFSLLQQAALYLDLNLVRDFIKKSDQPSAWLALSPEQMQVITKFAGYNFKFEGASREQQKELDRLKEQMNFAPLATAKVQEYFAAMKNLFHFITSLRGSKLYQEEEDKKIQLDEAFISLCRFYPEIITPGMLSFEFARLEKDMRGSSSDRMRDYLLGTGHQEPAPILQQILSRIPSETDSFNIAGTHSGTYYELIKNAAAYGHPEALKAVVQYSKPDRDLPFPLYQAGEGMTPHYQFVEPLVDHLALDIVFRKFPETVPQHLRDGAIAFQEKLGLQLAFLYRQPGIMGATALVNLIERGEEGASLFEKLEVKWKEYCKQNKKRYQPVDFDIITDNILNLPMEGDDTPRDFKVKRIKALYKLALLWKREEGMEGLERAIYGERRVAVKVFTKLVDIALLKEDQNEKINGFSKQAQNFFRRNLDVSRLTDVPPIEFFYYGSLAEDLSRLFDKPLYAEPSYPEYPEAFKLVQFIVTKVHGSSPDRLIFLLGSLERDHLYEGKPAETLKELILENDGRKSNTAWHELDDIFFIAWFKGSHYSGEDQKRLTGHMVSVAEGNNDKTLEAARSLISTCRRTSDPGLTQVLQAMSIDGITSRKNQDLITLGDLALIGNGKAFDYITDRFIQGDLSMKKAFDQILAEDADGVTSSLHEEIIDMATNLVLEEGESLLGLEKPSKFVEAVEPQEKLRVEEKISNEEMSKQPDASAVSRSEELQGMALNTDRPFNDRLASIRELANRASSYEGPETTATLKEIILIPRVEISIVIQALKSFIHLTNQQPPLPSLSMQMMELIQEATEIAQQGDNVGRTILTIIHELGNPWYRAQAQHGLDSLTVTHPKGSNFF